MPQVPAQIQPVSAGGGGGSGGGGGGGSGGGSVAESAAYHQNVTVNARVRPSLTADETATYPVTEVFYESSRYNQAALLTATLVADRYPEQGAILSLFANGTAIGTGFVDVSAPTDDGLVTIDAYDAVRRLHQATFTANYNDVPLDTIVGRVCAQAGLSYATDLSTTPELSVTYDGTPCSEVLGNLAQRVRGAWYVAPTTPGGMPTLTDSLDVNRYDIQYIKPGTDPGLQTAPYDGVVVIGGGEGAASITKDPIRATAGDTGSESRVKKHRDSSLTEQAEAARVAHSLLDEFERQQSTGQITLVGDERIQPLDTVRLPDALGGQEHLVSEVTHELSMDGFITTIQVGGLIDGDRGAGTPIGVREPTGTGVR